MNKLKAHDAQVYWHIIIETFLKKITTEKRHKKSEKPDHQSLKHLEALSSEHLKTSGIMPE